MVRAWEQFLRTGVAPSRVRPLIAQSWARCRQLGLDPQQEPVVDTLPHGELSLRLAAYRPLIALARPLLRLLVSGEKPAARTGSVALLADSEGVLLDVVTGPGTKTELKPGRKLVEECAGTCAVALAVREQRAAVVSGPEHYHQAYHDWACCAAPLRQGSRRPVAVLALAVRGAALDASIRSTVVRWAAALSGAWRAFHESVARQALLGARSPWPLLFLDAENRLVDCNPAAERELGRRRDTLVGLMWDELGFVEVAAASELEAPQWPLVRLGSGGNEARLFLAEGAPLRGRPGRERSRVLALVDISRWQERREQEEYRRRLALLEGLAAFAVHEVRNPLAAIRASAELAAMTPDPARRTALLRQIIGSLDELNRFLAGLMDMVRPHQVPKEPVDLGTVLQRLVELFLPQARTAGISLRVRGGKGALPVMGNEQLLSQAFAHLVRNALQATPAGGAVTVRWTRRPSRGSVLVSVRDTGSGIPPRLRRHLFTAGVSTKGRYEAGLGLLLSQRIFTETHGGRIWFRSQEGAGTTFYVELPLASSSAGTAGPDG